jgi:hypothetical protein
LLQSIIVDAKLLLAHEGFAAQLQENSFVLHCWCEYPNIPSSGEQKKQKGQPFRIALLKSVVNSKD